MEWFISKTIYKIMYYFLVTLVKKLIVPHIRTMVFYNEQICFMIISNKAYILYVVLLEKIRGVGRDEHKKSIGC